MAVRISGELLQIPFVPANRHSAERCGGDSKTAASAGLPVGFFAPPELVQAVLEGVFWCRYGDRCVLSRHEGRGTVLVVRATFRLLFPMVWCVFLRKSILESAMQGISSLSF